jgi:hypothetical protein
MVKFFFFTLLIIPIISFSQQKYLCTTNVALEYGMRINSNIKSINSGYKDVIGLETKLIWQKKDYDYGYGFAIGFTGNTTNNGKFSSISEFKNVASYPSLCTYLGPLCQKKIKLNSSLALKLNLKSGYLWPTRFHLEGRIVDPLFPTDSIDIRLGPAGILNPANRGFFASPSAFITWNYDKSDKDGFSLVTFGFSYFYGNGYSNSQLLLMPLSNNPIRTEIITDRIIFSNISFCFGFEVEF